jgi:photosystem II stability/assembly factor-like uncharacterized protein
VNKLQWRRLARALAIALAPLLCLCPVSARAEQWTETTPTGVSLNAVAFLSTTRVVAVGNGGKVLLSIDGGVSWSDVSPVGPVDNLNDVAFSGTNGVAVGDAGRILYSADSGGSWTDVSVPARPQLLSSVAFNGNTVVAVGDANNVGPPAGRYFTVVRSVNGGANWSEVVKASFLTAAAEQNLYDVAFVDAATLVAVGKRQGPNPTVLRSTDGGATWVTPTYNNPPNQNLNAVVVTGSVVMAVGDKDGPTVAMYRSTDAGATWDLPSSFPSGAPNNVPLIDLVAVSPTRFVAVGDAKSGGNGYRILVSSDAGDTWSDPATMPAGSEDLTAVAYGNSLVLAVGANGTILASTDQGDTWTQDDTQGSIADLLDVAIINPCIAVGSGGQVMLRLSSTSGSSSTGAGSTTVLSQESATVTVPVGYEWLAAVLLAAAALRRLR